MKQIYCGLGTLKDIKKIISQINDNFTGIIFVDNNVLMYNNSKLVNCIDKWGQESNIERILKNLPNFFKIEVIEHKDYNMLFEIIKSKNNYIMNNIKNDNNKENINNNNNNHNTDNDIDNDIDTDNSINIKSNNYDITTYSEIYKYVNKKKCMVKLTSKKYKLEEGIILFENGKEVCFAYISKNKTLIGNSANRKIKTLFAVSKVSINILILDEITFKKYTEKYTDNSKNTINFKELINSIKQNSNLKIVENTTLRDVIPKEKTLIEIKDNIYLLCEYNKPIYAFYKNYDGNKSYKLIKNLCILENINYKIYFLEDMEFNKFKFFINNKIKT